jgi:hypothetical protein
MTIKSFNFINDPLIGPERNWRELDTNTKFGIWEPTVNNITDYGVYAAYYQLFGPMVWYYIYLRSYGDVHGVANRSMVPSGAGTPSISNLPYGPETPSGKKSIQNVQWLECVNHAGTTFAAKAKVTTALSTSYIYLPADFASEAKLYIYGWILKDGV